MKAEELRGATQKYNSLPSSEKESIDRQFNEITAKVEKDEQDKIKDGQNMIQALSKEAAQHCIRVIKNGGYFQIPAKHGGNEFMPEQISAEQRIIEDLVRSIKYQYAVEQAVEILMDALDLNKIKEPSHVA